MYGSRAAPACLWCCAVTLAGLQQAPALQVNQASRAADASTPSSARSQQEIVRARRLLKAGSQNQAIATLRGVLRDEPENGDAHLLLGSALALVPIRSEALKELQRAVELLPSSAIAHFTLGTAQARFGDTIAACREFERTLQLAPTFAEAHVSLAMILGQQNNLTAARDHLVRAIQIQGKAPAAAHAHYLLARVLTEQGDLEKALQELTKAISLRPDDAEAFLAQGLIRKQQHNDAAAIVAFRKAATLAPRDYDAQYELGAAYLRHGDAAQAVEHLRQAVKSKPNDRSTLYQFCRALEKAGKTGEANACEQELSATIQTGLVSAANELTATQANNAGVELERAGNLTGAWAKYREAVNLNPRQTVFRRNMALALCRLGRWEEGIAELREVLKENPDDAEATKALYVALENAKSEKASGNPFGRTQSESK